MKCPICRGAGELAFMRLDSDEMKQESCPLCRGETYSREKAVATLRYLRACEEKLRELTRGETSNEPVR